MGLQPSFSKNNRWMNHWFSHTSAKSVVCRTKQMWHTKEDRTPQEEAFNPFVAIFIVLAHHAHCRCTHICNVQLASNSKKINLVVKKQPWSSASPPHLKMWQDKVLPCLKVPSSSKALAFLPCTLTKEIVSHPPYFFTSASSSTMVCRTPQGPAESYLIILYYTMVLYCIVLCCIMLSYFLVCLKRSKSQGSWKKGLSSTNGSSAQLLSMYESMNMTLMKANIDVYECKFYPYWKDSCM